MPSITLRLTDLDRQAIENLKTAYHESTASKALLRAARELPDLRTDLRSTQEKLAKARAHLSRIRYLDQMRKTHADKLKENADRFRESLAAIDPQPT